MTIAIIGKFYIEGTGLHLAEAIELSGHRVVRIDPEINLTEAKFFSQRMRNVGITLYKEVLSKHPKIRSYSSRKLLKRLKAEKVDLTISLHDYLTRDEVKSIKGITKSPVCIWFPDALVNLKRSMFFYANYDFLFFKDLYLVEIAKGEFNLNAHYLPQCCNPSEHKLIEINDTEKELYTCQITNAGNIYPSRAALLSQLMPHYNIKFWGGLPAVWLNVPELDAIVMGQVVYNAEKAKAFSAAKVVLNNLHPTEVNGLNKRSFEVAACGGFQITNYKPCTADLFEIDKEIVCYSTFGELREKLDYYIDDKNQVEREQIISAGRKRVLNEHTYAHRLNKIIDIVFN